MPTGQTGRNAVVGRVRELLEPRVEVLEAYLFGSTALGRDQEHSDIDVAVFVDEARCRGGSFGYRAELTTALMTGLGTDAVDAVILNHSPPLLYHRVLRDGVRVLARDLRATTVREATALSRYCDYLPQLDKLERARGEPAPAPRGFRLMSPGEIDERVIRRHLLALNHAVVALDRHAGQPVDLLVENSDERWTVERGLQLCAQNVLDVATHIAAGVGRDVPDYASAIDVIAEVGALPRTFAAGFRDVAGFRNILVHGYLEVDIEILHRVLNTRLREFIEFAGHVEDFLKSR